MSRKGIAGKWLLLLGRVLIVILLVASALLSGKYGRLANVYAFVLVLLGGVAASLMSYSGAEIREAFAHAAGVRGNGESTLKSALFWESAARNMWMLGVLASILGFVIVLEDNTGGIVAISTAMARSLLATLYGMVLAVVCYVPCWKLAAGFRNQPARDASRTREATAQETSTSLGFGNIIGYVLFLAVVTSILIKSSLSESWMVLHWIVSWPALLVVLGGTLALALFVGESASGPTISLSLAVTGLIGSLMGFIQALFGFVSKNVEDVAAGITLILSSCVAALLGMILVGAPLEDRRIKAALSSGHSTLSRIAWYVFPLISFLLLIMAFAAVITPMTIEK